MTMIRPVGPSPSGLPVRPATGGHGAAFTLPPDMATGPATVAAPPRTTAISSSLMLALQERAGEDAADREARQHGRRLLAALAELQRALLSGETAGALDRLAELAEHHAVASDPALAGIVGSIRLRARLEAARLDKRPGPDATVS